MADEPRDKGKRSEDPSASTPSEAPTYTPRAAYALDEPVVGETSDHLGERFAYSFRAGTVRPKSEQEEVALEQLYRLGRASRDGARVPRPGESEEASP